MFINSPSLLFDKDFLKKLDSYPDREIHVKITSLTFDEYPINEIEGNLTAGNMGIDGASAVRRTCNITMLTTAVNINELDWSLRTKFSVAIGLRNFVDPSRPDIIWFPQGIFIITQFSSTTNASGSQISISGKDKMCLLDGSISGALHATHDFGKIEEIAMDGTVTLIHEIPIYQIIREAIRKYAKEPWHRIVINDLEDCAVELIDYKLHDRYLYVIDTAVDANFLGDYDSQIIFGKTDNAKLFEVYNDKDEITFLHNEGDIFQATVPGTNKLAYIKLVKIVGYRDTAGYRQTTLTYPGELVLNAGSTITQLLDKIVSVLGDFEYYYDIDGRFIFQRKRTYFNQSWNNAVTNDRGITYYDNTMTSSPITYEFLRGLIVESFNNKPNLLNIRNDWSVWGVATGVSGIEIPVHLRYAIDDYPTSYTSLRSGKYYAASKEYSKKSDYSDVYDWRELIYQMAWDNCKYFSHVEELTYAFYHGYYHCDTSKISINNYSNYYRYDAAMATMVKIGSQQDYEDELKKENFIFAFGANNAHLAVSETLEAEIAKWEETWKTGYEAYYTDMLGFWRTIYNPDVIYKQEIVDTNGIVESIQVIDTEAMTKWKNNYYWNPDIIVCTDKPSMIRFQDPGKLTFWLEFLDTASDLGNYKVSLIGRRTKVVNDTNIKAIFYRETPGLLFIDPNSTQPQESTIDYVKINLVGGLSNFFTISTQGKSAKEVMDTLVYETTYYQDTITLNCLPVYYLEPNTQILVEDDITGIHGTYIIKSLNYSLAHNGSMSINATRLIERMI